MKSMLNPKALGTVLLQNVQNVPDIQFLVDAHQLVRSPVGVVTSVELERNWRRKFLGKAVLQLPLLIVQQPRLITTQ